MTISSSARGPRVLRIVTSLSVLVFLSCLIVTSALATFSDDNLLPQVPLSELIAPARMSELRFDHAVNKGLVSPALAEESRRTLTGQPLAIEPFLFAALRYFPTIESAGSAQAEPYLEEVLRRDPRSRPAHYLLFRRELATGDLAGAIIRLETFRRLEPDLVSQIMQVLGGRITTVAAADEVADALSGRSELVDGVVNGVVSGPASGAVVARLAERLPRAALVDSPAIPNLIERLVQDGYVAQARDLWTATRKVPGAAREGLINDPAFAQDQSHPPFGWTYLESPTGVAERRAEGAVYVEYYGRRSGSMLQQTMALSAGPYRVAMQFSPESGDLATLALNISCVGGQPVLASVNLGAQDRTRHELQTAFSVPPKCPGQVLEITGVPNERRRGGAVEIREIQVSAAGR